jgi:hypothetical protein
MLKKIWKKSRCTSGCVHTKSFAEKWYFWCLVLEDNFWFSKIASHEIFFIFLHTSRKMFFPYKILYVNIAYLDVHLQFFSLFIIGAFGRTSQHHVKQGPNQDIHMNAYQLWHLQGAMEIHTKRQNREKRFHVLYLSARYPFHNPQTLSTNTSPSRTNPSMLHYMFMGRPPLPYPKCQSSRPSPTTLPPLHICSCRRPAKWRSRRAVTAPTFPFDLATGYPMFGLAYDRFPLIRTCPLGLPLPFAPFVFTHGLGSRQFMTCCLPVKFFKCRFQFLWWPSSLEYKAEFCKSLFLSSLAISDMSREFDMLGKCHKQRFWWEFCLEVRRRGYIHTHTHSIAAIMGYTQGNFSRVANTFHFCCLHYPHTNFFFDVAYIATDFIDCVLGHENLLLR